MFSNAPKVGMFFTGLLVCIPFTAKVLKMFAKELSTRTIGIQSGFLGCVE